MTSYIYTERKLQKIYYDFANIRSFLKFEKGIPYSNVEGALLRSVSEIKRMSDAFDLTDIDGPILTIHEGISAIDRLLKAPRTKRNDQLLWDAIDVVDLWTEIIREYTDELGLEKELVRKQIDEKFKINGEVVEWMKIDLANEIMTWGADDRTRSKILKGRVLTVLENIKRESDLASMFTPTDIAIHGETKSYFASDIFPAFKMTDHMHFILIGSDLGGGSKDLKLNDMVEFV